MKLTWRGIFLLCVWLAIAIADGLLRLYYYQVEKQQINMLSGESWVGNLWFIFSIFLVALFIWELFSLKQCTKIEIKRQIPQTLPVNSFSRVVLQIINPTGRRFVGEVVDHYPDFCRVEGIPQTVHLNPSQHISVEYQLKAIERGELSLTKCELWINSEFSLLSRRFIFDCKSVSKIYPNYRSIHNYILLATEQKTRQLGIRQRQQRGDGLEFLQLREYRMGDNLRQIDWRASSRLQKLVSKEYQQERDQNIIFLLDSGRRMRTKDGELSHFDQSLNAMLLVASIALRQGDAVGLKVFGGKDLFLPPKKGPTSINAMLNQVYDLHPVNQASDLIAAAESLNHQFKKRSLVVIISNVRTEDESEIRTAVSLLKRHHLVMLANLKEQILHDVLSEEIYQLDDALRFAQTISYLQQRDKLHQSLVHEGVIAVDSLPKNLAVNMVNQYFDVKRSGRL